MFFSDPRPYGKCVLKSLTNQAQQFFYSFYERARLNLLQYAKGVDHAAIHLKHQIF